MKKLTFCLLALTLVFTSCEKLELGKKDKDKDCDFVYPITLVMPDDGIVTVNDEDEFDAAFENWKTQNPNSTAKPAFQYPIQMTNLKDETITINDDDELEKAFAGCKKYEKEDCGKDEHKDKKECFDLVYPITMTMPDATTVTGNDKEALGTAIKNWYIANPTSTEKPAFNYPIQITFEDGTTKTISNDTELETAYDDCKGWDKWKDCFDLVFPITMTMPDDTTVTGNDKEALGTAIKNWYTANPTSTEKPTFNYPIQITFKDGTMKTINNDIELKMAYDDCE